MTRRGLADLTWIRGVVAATTIVAMTLATVQPAAAVDTATFAGAILAPDNTVAQGFAVVFRDLSNGREFQSAQTTARSGYEVSVPVGARYELESVVAPDGTRLPVENVTPIPVRASGTNKLDVTFAKAGPHAPKRGRSATQSGSTPKAHSTTPWWKQPGPIAGLVLASGALIGLGFNLSNNHDSNPSPSTTGN